MKHLISIFNSLARGKKTLDYSDFENGFALVNYFINYEEYSSLYEASGGHPPKRVPLSKDTYLSAFTAFDRDRSGNIDIVEFIQGIAWLTRSQANLNTLDAAGDGVPQLPKSHLVRDGRNVNLAWSSRPQVVLVTKKWGSNRAKEALLEVGRWLKTAYNLRVLMDPNDPDGLRNKRIYCAKRYKISEHALGVSRLEDAVLYRDADFIAINKPWGLSVTDGPKIKYSSEVPILIHRLDTATAGVQLLARHKSAATMARDRIGAR
ncbi:hypothetical protein Pmar_PMAR020318 [Perkinsus marinus ATCC 50983]|uniref:EF-hand domain-containing protein n=1 Tax=Perkinsus marinus (strain ATCC 50983 / TXsc) TaxID=423536 RepID=C5KFD0_PERM5|nr:hypothetical protein Pmar_PMAR020318 [Perkinsus marinus ATCC 50983]EER16790.1 hypothetical protein Pmar_PMAR020318 [Perkinsus marinus ATCC 50983]|eukprot:XP_002784994.1 hypothetical protein Pmar_PMAR020318 [Perkinsus marinus ATCC 50983]